VARRNFDLTQTLAEASERPALMTLHSQFIYGGKIDNDFDQRLLSSFVRGAASRDFCGSCSRTRHSSLYLEAAAEVNEVPQSPKHSRQSMMTQSLTSHSNLIHFRLFDFLNAGKYNKRTIV